MRIAFASCMYNRVMADQPVWDWIAAQAPDHLLLLGDSLYLDLMTAEHPQTLDDDGFARHLYQLYSELIAHPQFAALVRALPPRRVHAIWDDHDFLWNDACGAELRTVQGGKIRLSTAFLEAFRLSLHHRLDPDSFPGSYDAPAFWNLAQPPLSTPSLDLGEGVLLHLSDGRTHRTRSWLLAEARRSLLGREQMQALGTVIAQAPAETVHLFASGSPWPAISAMRAIWPGCMAWRPRTACWCSAAISTATSSISLAPRASCCTRPRPRAPGCAMRWWPAPRARTTACWT